MSIREEDLLWAAVIFVAVFGTVMIYVLGGLARVKTKARMLAQQHPEAIAFAGYVYPLRFGTIDGATTRPQAAPRPFAFLADETGISVYGPWRSRARRVEAWSDIDKVEFDVLQSNRLKPDGMTVVGVKEEDSIDIRPMVSDLSALIDDLEQLRTRSNHPRP